MLAFGGISKRPKNEKGLRRLIIISTVAGFNLRTGFKNKQRIGHALMHMPCQMVEDSRRGGGGG